MKRPSMETITSKRREVNSFGRICKHQQNLLFRPSPFNVCTKSLHLSLVINESEKSMTKIRLMWWVQVSRISPSPLHQNGQSRTWNLHHDIFSRYIRAACVDPVSTYEHNLFLTLQLENMASGITVSNVYLSIYLYLHIKYQGCISLDWA